jgi:hypothetical protein
MRITAALTLRVCCSSDWDVPVELTIYRRWMRR